ncbi:MAG: hypothetical protein JWM98_2784 [Thermoleophilia bacterium]|nr:hypothetical protein [Thermoleophilia bacterium]
MSTTVTLQLNAANVAGDWATRSAGTARTGTGDLGASSRAPRSPRTDEIAVYLSELRGAVESIRRGAHSPSLADSRTEVAELAFGTPAMYCGIRFAIGFA